jgi:hypothetical protein
MQEQAVILVNALLPDNDAQGIAGEGRVDHGAKVVAALSLAARGTGHQELPVHPREMHKDIPRIFAENHGPWITLVCQAGLDRNRKSCASEEINNAEALCQLTLPPSGRGLAPTEGN